MHFTHLLGETAHPFLRDLPTRASGLLCVPAAPLQLQLLSLLQNWGMFAESCQTHHHDRNLKNSCGLNEWMSAEMLPPRGAPSSRADLWANRPVSSLVGCLTIGPAVLMARVCGCTYLSSQKLVGSLEKVHVAFVLAEAALRLGSLSFRWKNEWVNGWWMDGWKGRRMVGRMNEWMIN